MTVKILVGDVLAMLATLADDSVDCVVTSPPYWGLRDYGVEGQIGLERTLGEHLAVMIAVFREVRRVLKPTGTLWLNYGDCYATTPNGRSAADTKAAGNDDRTFRDKPFSTIGGVLKAKDLCMVPNRLAIALQEPHYEGKIRDIADRIWLAAMIDAEGCMFIHKRKAGVSNGQGYERKSDTYSTGLEVANTCEAIVRRCMQITGMGSICSQGPEQNKRRKQTIYRWNLRSNECRDIIRELYPHFVAKQHQARIILGCPSSGETAARAHAAVINLHNGIPTDCDFPAPKSMFSTGWYVRSEIIWKKPNPMPESIRDRPTTSHEKVFLLTKAERYFYNQEAVLQPASPNTHARLAQNVQDQIGSTRANGGAKTNGNMKAVSRKQDGHSRRHDGFNDRYFGKDRKLASEGQGIKNNDSFDAAMAIMPTMVNLRNVWSIPTLGFKEAHFATFPPELVERCLLAGCPAGGLVLDPFGGAGTTGLVADRLARDAILIELNPEYAEMARRRIHGDAPLFVDVQGA